MPTITIREQPSQEQQTQANGFRATLSFEDGGDFPIQVSDPLLPGEQELLAWYFERWLYQPHLEDVKVKKAVARIREYGQQLFEQVFADRDAYACFQNIDSSQTLQIEIVGQTPEFQALHWELLWPKSGRPLSLDCVVLRRTARPAPMSVQREASPLLNLLVVTARPDEESDVGYRTISRPLFESLGQSKIPVKIDLLRPGTFKALSQHLENHKNFYHIIHFDLHGALLTHAQFKQITEGKQSKEKKAPMTFKMRYGRSSIEEFEQFEGVQAFLSFEGEQKGETDLVEASELADLLKKRGVQVCILNACQSSKQIWPEGTDNRETSLTSYLMDAGIQLALGMSYSVTVSAAELLIPEMYKQIFANKSIPEAIRLGRLELFNNKDRRAYFGQTIQLQDWLLPVVYAQGKVNLNLRSFHPEEEEKWLEERSQRFPFTEPTYGFIGRDLDILKIEKSLLRHNLLLVKGMGGTGKTTLLNYLGMWWQQTRFVEKVFYFGYDEQAFTLESILATIAKSLLERFEHGRWQAMNPAARQQRIIDLLNSHSHCLFLDNLESISGRELAIAHTLPVAEREKLKKFLAALSGGKTKVVLGSRSQEEWLQPGSFGSNIHEMRGLDPEARTQLAEKILLSVVTPKRAEKILKEQGFERLMKLLAGYPLAMEVVLRNLKNQTPEQILINLQAADINLDTGSGEKTESILKCVEYSHSNIAPELQEVLLCLAPFTSFIDREDIPRYVAKLQEQEELQSLVLLNLDAALREAIQWGLLSSMYAEHPNLLTIQPVFPYFLKTKLEAVDPRIQSSIECAFREHYRLLARAYWQWMESKEAGQRQNGIEYCRLEYENLYRALEICLIEKEDFSIFFCLNRYLQSVQDKSTGLKLAEQVWSVLKDYPDIAKKDFEIEIIGACDFLAAALLAEKLYPNAKQQYVLAQQLINAATLLDERSKQVKLAVSYHQLGRVAEALREWEQAQQYYQQALDIKIQFNDIYSQAGTYHHLGRVAAALREWEQAQQYYQQALDIYIQFDDVYEQGETYHNLGLVAAALREWEQAQQYYQQALDIYIQFNDVYSQASTYGQLGNMAADLQGWEQARYYYQQALNIYIQFNDVYGQAGNYHNLGSVAAALREWEQARQYYQQALDIYIQFSDVYKQACIYHNLGIVVEELREWEQAQQYYQQALDIFIQFNDVYEQAATYHQLGIVAVALREWEQAQQYYQQALDIYIQFNDVYEQASTFHNLGSVSQELRDFEQARQYCQQALDIYIQFNDVYEQASTFHNLGRVAEEQQQFEEANNQFLTSLRIYAEYKDQHNLQIVVRNLVRVYQQHPDEQILVQTAQILEVEVKQIRSLFEQGGEASD
jgi:tetratricopeptide (TPR) repeat protein